MAAAESLGPVIERVVDAYLRKHGCEAMAAFRDPAPRPRSWEGLFALQLPFWRFVDAAQDQAVGAALRREYIRAAGSALVVRKLLEASPELASPRSANMNRLACETPIVEDHDLALRMIEVLAEMRPDLVRELAERQFEKFEGDDDPVLTEVHPKLVQFWEEAGFPYETQPWFILRHLQVVCFILASGHGSPETAANLGITADLRRNQPP